MQRTIGATAHPCSVHGNVSHVIVEIKNNTATTTLKICIKCLERSFCETKTRDDW